MTLEKMDRMQKEANEKAKEMQEEIEREKEQLKVHRVFQNHYSNIQNTLNFSLLR